MNYLYFAPNKEKTGFKMGFSITPDLRLDAVVGDINYRKTYLFECGDAQATEDFCHRYFKDFNIKLYTGDGASEWYDICIFKVALRKVLKHSELLDIGRHFKFLEQFSPVDRTPPSYPVEGLVEIDEPDIRPPDEGINKIHRKNYANLQYLVNNMASLDWEYRSSDTYELRYAVDDYPKVEEMLKHNKYLRDSGHGCGYFRVHYKSKTKHTSHLVIHWTLVNSNSIRRTSKSDLRLECMVGMLDELHTQMLDRTFCL